MGRLADGDAAAMRTTRGNAGCDWRRGGFERSSPNPTRSSAEVVAFYTEHRTALLAHSLRFVLSSGIFLWFVAALRSYLARAEGHPDPGVHRRLRGGITWIVINLVVQARRSLWPGPRTAPCSRKTRR